MSLAFPFLYITISHVYSTFKLYKFPVNLQLFYSGTKSVFNHSSFLPVFCDCAASRFVSAGQPNFFAIKLVTIGQRIAVTITAVATAAVAASTWSARLGATSPKIAGVATAFPAVVHNAAPA